MLLAARTKLYAFVRSVLIEDEVRDGLIFAGATLVVLPLLPDQAVGPYGSLNPRAIWIIVILVMAIGAAGHISIRLLGAYAGLPIAGFASGFVSSTATIGAMGARAPCSAPLPQEGCSRPSQPWARCSPFSLRSAFQCCRTGRCATAFPLPPYRSLQTL